MKTIEIYNILDNLYEKKIIFLEAENDFQLLIGVILSAQTTDKQVNSILPELFENYPTPEKLGKAEINNIIEIIHPVGFFNIKAANIIKTADIIHKKHGDAVPAEMSALLQLPGVGRKSANVVRGQIFNLPAIIVDTHFQRTVTRLGLTSAKQPNKVEEELNKIVPEKLQYRFSMLINKHGRTICKAKKPLCEKCGLISLCQFYN
ncbi:MAG: endonuclease III [Spirochaetales bacterium]|nr:endonuclease III [Spirochaetales bacterium]